MAYPSPRYSLHAQLPVSNTSKPLKTAAAAFFCRHRLQDEHIGTLQTHQNELYSRLPPAGSRCLHCRVRSRSFSGADHLSSHQLGSCRSSFGGFADCCCERRSVLDNSSLRSRECPHRPKQQHQLHCQRTGGGRRPAVTHPRGGEWHLTATDVRQLHHQQYRFTSGQHCNQLARLDSLEYASLWQPFTAVNAILHHAVEEIVAVSSFTSAAYACWQLSGTSWVQHTHLSDFLLTRNRHTQLTLCHFCFLRTCVNTNS